LRLELEFETLDEERKDAMDVEEIKMKEQSIIKGYLHRQDESYTSAHIKAGRKIMAALKRIRNLRLGIQNTVVGAAKTLSTFEPNAGFGHASEFSVEELKVSHQINAQQQQQPGVTVNS
jgi:membrane-anchored protein YejM (alkaline phosphatase superfamily)